MSTEKMNTCASAQMLSFFLQKMENQKKEQNITLSEKDQEAYTQYLQCVNNFYEELQKIVGKIKNLAPNEKEDMENSEGRKIQNEYYCLCRKFMRELDDLALKFNTPNYIALCALTALAFSAGSVVFVETLAFLIVGIILMAGGIINPLTLAMVFGIWGLNGFVSGLATFGFFKGLGNEPLTGSGLSFGINTFGILKENVSASVQQTEIFEKTIEQDLMAYERTCLR